MLFRRLALAAAAALTLGGCATSPDTSGPLPDADTLVDQTATGLRELRSVDFDFTMTGVVPGFPVTEAHGVAQRAPGPYGSAQGEARVRTDTSRTRYDFALSGGSLVLTDGDDDRMPHAVAGLTPALLLGEDGLSRLVDEARNVRTEGREDLGDVPTYRVGGELPAAAVAALLPGVHADVDVKFWIRQSAGRELMRVWVQVPPQRKNAGAATLELALSQHDVSVEAPAGQASRQ